MSFNVSVIKDSGNTTLNGARVETIAAQGSTCLEIVAQDSDRDGVMIMNRDTSIEVGITLISNPTGAPNSSTLTTAQAWALRIAKILPGTTELMDVKAGTRVLLSTASGTPSISWQEVNA